MGIGGQLDVTSMAVLRQSLWGLLVGESFSDVQAMKYNHVPTCCLYAAVMLQLGAGMEGFMIKTGFYNKYAQSLLSFLY